MSNFKTIAICGRVGQDPQVKTVGQNNTQVLEFGVAVNSKVNNQDQTDWFQVGIWGEKRIQSLLPLIRKGTLLYVSGDLKVSIYTAKQTNAPQIAMNVTADKVELLADYGQPNQQGGYQQQGQPQQYQQPAPQQQYQQPAPQQGGYQSMYQQPAPQQQYQQPAPQQYAQPQQAQGQPQQYQQPAPQQQYQQPAPQQAPAPQGHYPQHAQVANPIEPRQPSF